MATEAQAPASQPLGQQLSTGASVEGGDIKLEVVPPLYTSVLFCPVPKVIPNFGSDCSLERMRLCSVFPYPSFERSVGSGTCATFVSKTEDFHDHGVNWKEAQSGRHVSPKFQTTTASTTGMVVFRSH